MKEILYKIMFSIGMTAFLFLLATLLAIGIIYLCKIITTFVIGVIIFLIITIGIFIAIKDY